MKKLRITVGKKTYDVTVEVLDEGASPTTRSRQPRGAAISASGGESPPPVPAAAASGSVVSPMAGVIKSILVKPGDSVEKGQDVVILEAMKMENQISAPESGSIKSIDVEVGQSVTEGQALLLIE